MIKDYYKILRIGKKAREEDIKKAYHNLALKYHPDKNKEHGAEQRFKEILEAYQVLSDKNRRYKYDMNSESKIQHKKCTKTYSPWTNPYDLGDTNDLTMLINLLSKINPTNVYRFEMYGPTRQQSSHSKEQPIERDIFVSLEELIAGVSRKVKFSRLSYGGLRREYKILDVNIRPGCKAGTKILFSREGDRLPGTIPADIIFVVRERPHPFFERIGSDIKFTTQISLRMALNGNFIVNIPTLEGKTIQLPIKNEIIKPNTIKIIPRRGLPDWHDPKKRGNLLVTFKIKYPETMSAKSRKMVLRNLLN